MVNSQDIKEPEVVAWMREWDGDVSDEGHMLFADCVEDTHDGKQWAELITLQSHREAMQEQALKYVSLFGDLQEAHEAIANQVLEGGGK